MPLSVVIILLILAIVFYKKHQTISRYSLVIATLLLVFSTLPYTADLVTYPIEKKYSAFTQSSEPIDHILILGCGHTSDANYPATSELQTCSLQRMVEGLRIYQLHPEATFITSGAAFSDSASNADKVKQALISLGVSENVIEVEPRPKDTEEEALLISPKLIGKNVVLVTNPDHMFRALKYFKQQGITPLAAPCSPMVKNVHGTKGWAYYFPHSNKLQQTTIAWYETLGAIAQWFKALI